MAQYLEEGERSHGIDSVQNGLLLHAGLHPMWDAWMISINPVTLTIENI
jgi:HNH endonuclease